MRLLIVAETASAHTEKWACAFADRGHEVLVVSATPQPIAWLPKSAGSLQVVTFPGTALWTRLPRVKFGGGWQRWLSGWAGWRRIVRGFAPDIVHVHYLTADVRNYFYYAKPLVHKLVVSSWGSDVVFDEQPPRVIAKRLGALLARADRITATTHFLAQETQRFTDQNRNIEVIGFGVDTDLFHPKDEASANHSSTGGLVLGWAKNLDEKYGTRPLVEAFAQLHQRYPSLRLHLAGTGPDADFLRTRFAELGLTEHVAFLGRLPKEKVAEFLRQVDIFVMPSLCQESFGVSALEAAASGLPVVATRQGGIPEAVVENESALLVPPGDPQALAVAISRLIEEPSLRRLFGDRGRRFVVESFPWQESVGQMAAVYDDLLGLAEN